MRTKQKRGTKKSKESAVRGQQDLEELTQDVVDLTQDVEQQEQEVTLEQEAVPTPPQRKRRNSSQQQPVENSNKRSKKAAKPQEEKRTNRAGRTVRYSSQPSIQVAERIQRALPGSGHRLFLIQRGGLVYDEENVPKEEFTVLGATGNVYTVTIDKHPHCSCPDHAKGNICKHILFVLIRVMKLKRNDPLVWQKAYLTDEVFDIFEKAGNLGEVGGDVLAPKAVLKAFSSGMDGEEAGEEAEKNEEGRRKVEGDCPICFDELVDGAEQMVWCTTCGNNIHKGCFDRWQKQKGARATCVYCRAPWPEEHHHDSGKPDGGEYLNLAQHSSVHRNEDTSLEALYGDRAYWIYASQGRMGRGTAANFWRASQHR